MLDAHPGSRGHHRRLTGIAHGADVGAGTTSRLCPAGQESLDIVEEEDMPRRTRRTGPEGDDTYTYDSDSNRLLAVTGPNAEALRYDAAGNTVARGPRAYVYNDAGRLAEVTLSGAPRASYVYNARGERSLRRIADRDTVFVFGQDGQLLMETDGAGTVIREHVYADGRLLALLDHAAMADSDQLRFTAAAATLAVDAATRRVHLALADGSVFTVTVAEADWHDTDWGGFRHVQFSGIDADRVRLSGAMFFQDGAPAGASVSLHVPPPRDGDYSLSAPLGTSDYTGSDPATGRTAALSVDAATRTVTVHEAGYPSVTVTVAAQHWHPGTAGAYDTVTFHRETGDLRIDGGTLISADANLAWLKTRAGEARSHSHDLPAVTSPSGLAVRHVHVDHLGTPQALTDASGRIVWQADYLPFGQVLESVAEVAQEVRFAGQFLDSEVGWYYNYQRYYGASTGRYLTSDPIGLDGGIGTYGYALSNPLRYSDPEGLVSVAEALGRLSL